MNRNSLWRDKGNQCNTDLYRNFVYREEEAEQNRIEELTSGGFIPPQSEIDAPCYEVKLERYSIYSL